MNLAVARVERPSEKAMKRLRGYKAQRLTEHHERSHIINQLGGREPAQGASSQYAYKVWAKRRQANQGGCGYFHPLQNSRPFSVIAMVINVAAPNRRYPVVRGTTVPS